MEGDGAAGGYSGAVRAHVRHVARHSLWVLDLDDERVRLIGIISLSAGRAARLSTAAAAARAAAAAASAIATTSAIAATSAIVTVAATSAIGVSISRTAAASCSDARCHVQLTGQHRPRCRGWGVRERV